MPIFGIVFLLLLVTACGKSNSRAGYPRENYAPVILPADGSNISGLYMAKFSTLNPQVNGTIPGSATLFRDGEKFYAYLRLFGGAAHTWHQQNVHEGNRCPNLSDDLNGDGYIDIQEGEKVWGKVILPLDSIISSQKAGKNIYPVADETGSYFYERVTSFDKMFQDLKSEDKNLEDNFRKLLPEEGLDFTGKVVVVHGTAETIVYPETVATSDNRPVYQTLPVACGLFEKITRVPGEPLPEEIPGPVGEVEEGGPDTGGDYESDDGYGHPEPQRERDRWYDRIVQWWRSTWERDRGSRSQNWGNGSRWFF